MKRIITLLVAVGFIGTINAQITEAESGLKTQSADTTQGWKTGGSVGLNFSQVALVNWAGGGLNSISIGAGVNLFANYRKDKISWENGLDLAYGVIRQGSKESPWIKNDDRIDFTSKAGYKLKNNLYAAALYNFRSQFAPGYASTAQVNIISRFASPAYSLFALGIDYNPGVWSVFVAPITLKTTIVADQDLANAGAFGVTGATYDGLGNVLTAGKQVRNEFGGYLKFRFKKDLVKNVNFETKLDLFSNYLNNPQNIDVNWQVLVAMKINKFLTANLSTHLIYDHDINITEYASDGSVSGYGPRTQFKEAFGLGLSYNF